jgi:5-(carboxyamino)imidazole ribonucleotide mutase
MRKAKIAIIMGSKSDLPIMQETAKILNQFNVGFTMRVLSAHRTPRLTAKFASSAESRGYRVVIAGAGGAAALAGVIAAHTTLPVIGVPIETKSLKGLDSLLSTVQMPSGVPVACVAIGSSGAKNAAMLAIQILSLTDNNLKKKLIKYRKSAADSIKRIRL